MFVEKAVGKVVIFCWSKVIISLNEIPYNEFAVRMSSFIESKLFMSIIIFYNECLIAEMLELAN